MYGLLSVVLSRYLELSWVCTVRPGGEGCPRISFPVSLSLNTGMHSGKRTATFAGSGYHEACDPLHMLNSAVAVMAAGALHVFKVGSKKFFYSLLSHHILRNL